MIESKYIIEPDVNKYVYVKNLEEKGLRPFIEERLPWLDCTKMTKNGQYRINQTINVYYKILIGECMLAFRVCQNDKDFDELFNKVNEIHEANLKYEKENPPIIYETDKVRNNKGSSSKRKSTKDTNTKKVKRETIADRKAKIIKSFKFVTNG